MSITILDIQYDKVIKSVYISTVTNYNFAIENLVPLIDKFEQQRYTLRPTFYQKLERDIIKGCIMPPLTLALNYNINISEDFVQFLQSKITDAFVLDGVQRLNTLKRIGKDKLDLDRPIYVNILICSSMDKLLYRMITLNNGQKPMSARHQVEILANNLYDFNDLKIIIQSEKQQKKRRINKAFQKGDIIKGYLAFISNSVNIDNQKIIESKLDELITDKIIESDLTEREIEFSDVINIVNKFSEYQDVLKWFRNANNLIGFAAGITNTYKIILEEKIEIFDTNIKIFEEAFSYLDVSKIKLGLARRKAVKYFTENYLELKNIDVIKLTDIISQEI